jgi:hypothetical protein
VVRVVVVEQELPHSIAKCAIEWGTRFLPRTERLGGVRCGHRGPSLCCICAKRRCSFTQDDSGRRMGKFQGRCIRRGLRFALTSYVSADRIASPA